jgi:hypothetical protein
MRSTNRKLGRTRTDLSLSRGSAGLSRTPIPNPPGPDSEKLAAIVKLAFRTDSLVPRAKLSPAAVVKVAAVLVYMGEEFLEFGCDTFRDRTTLIPSTRAYNRAEFFNVWWFMARMTGAGSLAHHEPYYLASYDVLETIGCGPLPKYQSARAQLREIVSRVRRALDPKTTLGRRWRERTLSQYPLIADWLPTFEPQKSKK